MTTKLDELISRLLGGRPMKRIGFAFNDIVSGKPVFYFKDHKGIVWMAEHRWAWFRARAAQENR